MANLLPLPGPLPPLDHLPAGMATIKCKSFVEWYGDAQRDPCRGEYQQIMNRFDPDVNNTISHIILLEQAAGAGAIPQAFLCCSLRQQRVRIYCLHLPSKYIGALDGRITPWDGKVFAFVGDVSHNTATTVQLPDNAFRAFINVRVKTTDYMVTHLDELTDLGFPVVQGNDPESEVVSTRQMMYLPARYVPLLLDSAGYSIRDVWEILYPALVNDGNLASCATLVKWLRVASTRSQAGQSIAAQDMEVPLVDGNLASHRMGLLKQALPALFQPAESLELALTQMAAAVTQNTNDSRVAREQRAAQAAEPKLPSDRFTITLPILQEYLEVADERNLPQLWHQWANCTKKQEFNVLNELLQAYSRGPEAFSNCAPIISAKLVQDLLNFSFVSDALDDIKSGIQPFLIADGSAEHRQANLELSRIYGLLNSGEQSIMLADLELLKAKEVQSIPLNYFELERNLGMFGNFLGTVLGSQHTVTQAYRSFWTLLSQGYRTEIQQVVDVKNFIKPAHILRSIQLICYNWFAQKRNRLRPPAPEFVPIIHNIILNTYLLPHLPPTLYKLAYGRTTTSSVPSLAGSSTSSLGGSSSSVATGLSSDASTVSGLTVPTSTGTHTPNAKIINLTPDLALQRLIAPGTKLKDLMGSEPPPLLDDNTQICLSFHLMNSCWSNCRRGQGHSKPLSPTERARLEHYVRSQMAKLRPPTSANPPSTVTGGAPTQG